MVQADWRTATDVKAYDPSARYVGSNRWIFNLLRNRYRLVVKVMLPASAEYVARVYVRFPGTHAEYDRISTIKTIQLQIMMLPVISPPALLIRTGEQYQAGMARLELLEDTAPHEALEIDGLSAALDTYENDHGHAPLPPDPLRFRIERYRHEHRLQKQELAALLGITGSRLSEVLNGKRAVNLDLARRLHLKLGIEAEFILRHA